MLGTYTDNAVNFFKKMCLETHRGFKFQFKVGLVTSFPQQSPYASDVNHTYDKSRELCIYQNIYHGYIYFFAMYQDDVNAKLSLDVDRS